MRCNPVVFAIWLALVVPFRHMTVLNWSRLNDNRPSRAVGLYPS